MQPSPVTRLRHLITGRPRDLADQRLFRRLTLIPFLAWVGLGADGLSSSAYGPEEAFKALAGHTYLVIPLAALMAGTVLLIAAGYSRIIERFPAGGGGYVVATRLLGPGAGVVSGSALLVDYVLTITVSIAAAGDALFSLRPEWAAAKLPLEIGFIVGLTILNVRGVKESVVLLLPIFLAFLATHAVLIGGGLLGHAGAIPATAARVAEGYREGSSAIGVGGLLLVFLRAYSLGGGTYTGIEAVSNGLPIMREPRVPNGKRTMVYMALSLAITATGLLICYLLWDIRPAPGKTMNALLIERWAEHVSLGGWFVVVALLSEGLLLVVAAQAGFLDGPRVLANMAVDSWVPHRFAALSERLTTRNGILLMGGAALAALWYTGGNVGQLVVMYAINVFVTFSLSMGAMLRYWLGREPKGRPERGRRVALFGAGLLLCVTILTVTVIEKFREGGWITVVITAIVIGLCGLVRRHYRRVRERVDELYRDLGDLPSRHEPGASTTPAPLDPAVPTAAVLVGSYGGVGIHTLLNVFRSFPGQYRQVVFLSVAVLDSGEFKGEAAVAELREKTAAMLARYAALAGGMGVAASWRVRVGTDVVAESEQLCLEVARELRQVTFFAGQLVFRRDRWYDRLLHNQTAAAIQRRLHLAGRTMVTLPVRVRAAEGVS